MSQPEGGVPVGVHTTDGIVHRRSPVSVAETVERLTTLIAAAGAKVFTVIDHSGEAEHAGLSLRETKVVVFGSPVAGTPVMAASPLAALDLPLKVLVWADDGGTVWMSYCSARWLADRHGVPDQMAGPLGAPDALTGRVASST
ncbi:MAG TPA: DUF302 domain-containing protein [Candidatus Dormibacteraeota bacterium]|nr:DUF302 domain-containing protein [Candidatus Dormibacteraeota bacterium]